MARDGRASGDDSTPESVTSPARGFNAHHDRGRRRALVPYAGAERSPVEMMRAARKYPLDVREKVLKATAEMPPRRKALMFEMLAHEARTEARSEA